MSRKLKGFMAVAVAAGVGAVTAATGSAGPEGCFGLAPTITGSGTIDGTEGNDVIVGGDGGDLIRGYGGDDRVCGGGGDDRIGGGPGGDQLAGGPGADQIDGGPGNDTILGGEGDDVMRCGTDDDTADGGPGANTAETTGFEGCESVANAVAPGASPPGRKRLKATLTPGRVVPRPRDTERGARGVFTATMTVTESGATLVWRLKLRDLTGEARAVHVHAGRPGKTGPVLVTLCRSCRATASGTAQLRGQPARRAVNQGEAYVDVHTARNRKGELRGQLPRLAP